MEDAGVGDAAQKFVGVGFTRIHSDFGRIKWRKQKLGEQKGIPAPPPPTPIPQKSVFWRFLLCFTSEFKQRQKCRMPASQNQKAEVSAGHGTHAKNGTEGMAGPGRARGRQWCRKGEFNFNAQTWGDLGGRGTGNAEILGRKKAQTAQKGNHGPQAHGTTSTVVLLSVVRSSGRPLLGRSHAGRIP